MVNILLVEDNPAKAEKLVECMTSVGGIEFANITVANDLVSARDALTKQYFDLVILDIRLPNVAGDEIEDGGVSLVKELRTSTTLLKPFHIIGVTAYDDALDEVEDFFDEEVWFVIKYDPGVTRWQSQLKRKLSYLVRSKQELLNISGHAYLYDFAIITALEDPELRAVLHLSDDWIDSFSTNDATVYRIGSFHNEHKRFKVVAASAPEMGMPASAVLSMKLITQFRPRYLVMLGIAAGLPGDNRNLGDILVAERCWNYEAGKKAVTKEGQPKFLPDPMQVPLDTALREKFNHMKSKHQILTEIQQSWQGEDLGGRLSAHVGPVASGSAVVADQSFRDGLKDQQQRKLIGIEMEGYSIFYAAQNCAMPQPIPILIKSICDFATTPKESSAQRYAAFTSAQFFLRFALEYLEPIGTQYNSGT